jgi:hypothetical protein
MLAKTDFTAEEWNVIRRAPFTAGLLVVAASPNGPFGVVKELFARQLGGLGLRPRPSTPS